MERLRESDGRLLPTHGGSYSAEYDTWAQMRHRCNTPSSRLWPRYGGRGITVCERWDEFASFLSDMGPRPEGMTIDRVDVNGNYEPGNCRRASMKQQQNNRRNTRRFTLNGETRSLSEWCEHFGISFNMVAARLRSGWPLDRLFSPRGQYATNANGRNFHSKSADEKGA